MRKTFSITFAGLILVAAGVFGQIAPVDEPAVCYECHVDISDLSNKAHVHGAFESGKCSDCHNPHASKHAAMLADNEADLCPVSAANVTCPMRRISHPCSHRKQPLCAPRVTRR